MKNTINIRYAHSLSLATMLMLFTMVLHPSGGSIEHIQHISTMVIITHAVAIFSIPFWILGFWGLTKQLEDDSLIALAAFIAMCAGMLAVMLAATVNGLVLPLFVNHYTDATPEKLTAIKPVIIYNTTLNHAFDLVFTGAGCTAVLLWSVAILKTRKLPVWLAWTGIILSAIALIAMCSGFVFTDLAGFRIFMAGFAIWAVVLIVALRTQQQ